LVGAEAQVCRGVWVCAGVGVHVCMDGGGGGAENNPCHPENE